MHFRGHFKGVLRGFHGGMLECFRVVLGGVLGWFRGVFDGAKWLPAPVSDEEEEDAPLIQVVDTFLILMPATVFGRKMHLKRPDTTIKMSAYTSFFTP